jgi:hypothetical protein
MSEKAARTGVQVRLTGLRQCFTYLYDPHTSKKSGNQSYRTTLIVPPGSEQDKAIRAAITQAAKNAWGDKAAIMVQAFKDDVTKFPYRDGGKPDGNGNVNPDLAGSWTLTAIAGKNPPTMKDETNRDLDPLVKNGKKLYPGAVVTAVVEVWAQKGETAGIRCQLQGVRHDADGKPIGGGGQRRASTDEFGPPPGNPDADADILGGSVDDDIPF